MTWDDNILTRSRARHRLLMARRGRLITYAGLHTEIEYDSTGAATRLIVNPFIRARKARRLIYMINLELYGLQKILRKFV